MARKLTACFGINWPDSWQDNKGVPHKPKSVREIYTDSIGINLASLQKDMADHGLGNEEVGRAAQILSEAYSERMREIEILCGKDPVALESVPSPLELLMECIERTSNATMVSPGVAAFLGKYLAAIKEWNT